MSNPQASKARSIPKINHRNQNKNMGRSFKGKGNTLEEKGFAYEESEKCDQKYQDWQWRSQGAARQSG